MAKCQRKTKKQNQKAHAKDAFRERYGEEINRERYNQLVDYIRNLTNNDKVQVTLIKKCTNRESAYWITEEDKKYKCIYDKQRRTIVTFLEEDMRVY